MSFFSIFFTYLFVLYLLLNSICIYFLSIVCQQNFLLFLNSVIFASVEQTIIGTEANVNSLLALVYICVCVFPSDINNTNVCMNQFKVEKHNNKKFIPEYFSNFSIFICSFCHIFHVRMYVSYTYDDILKHHQFSFHSL